MPKKSIETKVWDELLYLYDFHIRAVAKAQARKSPEDYACGYADGIGQIILNLGKIYGETWATDEPYKHEAYKRIMEFTSAAAYVRDYPEPVESTR